MSDKDKMPFTKLPLGNEAGQSGAPDDLAGLFALARASAPEPSEALAARVLARATAAQGGPVPVDRTGAEGRARGPGPFGRWMGRWVGAGGLALAGAVGFAAGFAGLLDAAPLPAGSLFPAQAVQQAVQAEDTANLSFLTDGAPGASVLLGASDGTSD